jgi:3-oxoacyl-[acyl-carrier protein] reductase
MTGAASTLGRALLRRLWAEPAWAGVRFYLVGRDAGALGGLCDEARDAGRDAAAWILDLADPRSAAAGADALRSLPPVQGLCFAAGALEDGPLAMQRADALERVWAVNFAAHRALLRALAGPGRLAQGSRGLLVGSLSGARGNAGQTAYALSKGALAGLLPLAPGGLRLNLLLPPLMPSPLMGALNPAARERLYRSRLMEDPDPAASAASAAAFLLSDASAYVHRQVIHADTRVGAYFDP